MAFKLSYKTEKGPTIQWTSGNREKEGKAMEREMERQRWRWRWRRCSWSWHWRWLTFPTPWRPGRDLLPVAPYSSAISTGTCNHSHTHFSPFQDAVFTFPFLHIQNLYRLIPSWASCFLITCSLLNTWTCVSLHTQLKQPLQRSTPNSLLSNPINLFLTLWHLHSLWPVIISTSLKLSPFLGWFAQAFSWNCPWFTPVAAPPLTRANKNSSGRSHLTFTQHIWYARHCAESFTSLAANSLDLLM